MIDFISPSRGTIALDAVMQDVVDFVSQDSAAGYQLIVGTDSQTRQGRTVFVNAIVVHRCGKGARFFYRQIPFRKIASLRHRLMYEATMSIELADQLSQQVYQCANEDLQVEIHLDLGNQGASKELIRELVGMVSGSGFAAKIKPDSFGASTVADRFSK